MDIVTEMENLSKERQDFIKAVRGEEKSYRCGEVVLDLSMRNREISVFYKMLSTLTPHQIQDFEPSVSPTYSFKFMIWCVSNGFGNSEPYFRWTALRRQKGYELPSVLQFQDVPENFGEDDGVHTNIYDVWSLVLANTEEEVPSSLFSFLIMMGRCHCEEGDECVAIRYNCACVAQESNTKEEYEGIMHMIDTMGMGICIDYARISELEEIEIQKFFSCLESSVLVNPREKEMVVEMQQDRLSCFCDNKLIVLPTPVEMYTCATPELHVTPRGLCGDLSHTRVKAMMEPMMSVAYEVGSKTRGKTFEAEYVKEVGTSAYQVMFQVGRHRSELGEPLNFPLEWPFSPGLRYEVRVMLLSPQGFYLYGEGQKTLFGGELTYGENPYEVLRGKFLDLARKKHGPKRICKRFPLRGVRYMGWHVNWGEPGPVCSYMYLGSCVTKYKEFTHCTRVGFNVHVSDYTRNLLRYSHMFLYVDNRISQSMSVNGHEYTPEQRKSMGIGFHVHPTEIVYPIEVLYDG